MENAFELSHILYLVFSFALIAAGIFLIKRYCTTKRSIEIATFAAAGALLFAIVWNRIAHAVVGHDARQLMPYSYCSMTSLLLSIATLVFYKNRNHYIFHCLCYIGLIGPIAAVIFPGNILGVDSTFFAQRTLTFFFHHSLLLFLSILLLATGQFKPDWRRWWCFILGLCFYITFGLFQIQALHMEHSMEINKPFIDDTFLTWYFTGTILALPLMMIIACIYEYAPRYLKRKKSAN